MPERQSPLRQSATRIVRQLQIAGHSAFFVGGSVRDLLLGREPGDYDVVTSALPEQIEALFPRTIPVGRKFGVVVVVEDHYQHQVATFRAETDYRDGRHPDKVTFGDARADVLRRDFTVNGLLLDPITGELCDWVGGSEDLGRKLIRTIGVAEDRFGEDHLRMLRAVRLAAQLGFEIENETFTALKRNASRIQGISAERIRDELIKLFAPPHAARGIELLRESGLLRQVLPEIAATEACEQTPNFHPEGNVFNHIRLMLSHLPPGAPASLSWAAILHDVAKPLTASADPNTGGIHFYGHEKVGATLARQILERLRFPRKQIEEVAHAVRCHMQFKDAPQMRKSTLRLMLMRPTFELELALHRLDCLGSHGRLDVYDFLVKAREELTQQPQIIPPLIKGDDLKALGMRSGPEMGRILADVRERQLQDELASKSDALAYVRQKLKSSRRASSRRGSDEPHSGGSRSAAS